MPRQSPLLKLYCLTNRNFHQNRVINHLIDYGVKGQGEVCSYQDEDSYDKDDMTATLTILKTI